MIDREYALMMARYNHWMNTRLYQLAAGLSDAERKADRGAFFKSLQGTFEHLIYADTAWMARFAGRSIDGLFPAVSPFADFDALQTRRETLDLEILAWVETLTPEWLQADFTYYSKAYDAHFTRPAWQLVVHVFNHQTHHRGQATTLLMQMGIDPGATDLPVLPDPAQ